MDTVKFAFIGFRHGHIMSLYDLAQSREDIEVVASCEEDATTRAQLQSAGKVTVTHSSYADMLERVPCDVVAVGDYFGIRGARVLEALRRGKHVVSDKPICTSLAELDQIEALAKERGLSVGCQFDMRDRGTDMEVRRLLREGAIGDVHSIVITGQHPMLYGSRPGWYYEQGKHGGTINDIAIHAVDAIPWLTGHKWATVESARAWNAALTQEPIFQDGAQFMATLSNGCGVLCDVSYLSPNKAGYKMPQYWRMAFAGSKGFLEALPTIGQIILYNHESEEPHVITTGPANRGGYLDSFLREMGGQKEGLHLSTQEVFEASRVSLLIQQAADRGQTRVSLA